MATLPHLPSPRNNDTTAVAVRQHPPRAAAGHAYADNTPPVLPLALPMPTALPPCCRWPCLLQLPIAMRPTSWCAKWRRCWLKGPQPSPAGSGSVLHANHSPLCGFQALVIWRWKALLLLFPTPYQRPSGSYAAASGRRASVNLNLQDVVAEL